MRIQICADYTCYSYHELELPEGVKWEDIEGWYVKWNCFHYRLKGQEEWVEHDMGGIDLDSIDSKRPVDVQIIEVDEDNNEINVLEEFD